MTASVPSPDAQESTAPTPRPSRGFTTSSRTTRYTFADLNALGFPITISRPTTPTLAGFINGGHLARVVKLADLEHNLDESRGPLTPKADKYRAAHALISAVEEP